jgi:hypothetical protein
VSDLHLERQWNETPGLRCSSRPASALPCWRRRWERSLRSPLAHSASRSATVTFPIARSDPAHDYDPNPNRIAAQHLAFDVPAKPVAAEHPACLPMGMIGFTTTGVALYSALDDAGRDSAAHEIQDLCDGHPQGNSQYHYHSGSLCIPGAESDSLVGWALDGYPIFGMKGGDGRTLA